MKFSVRGLAFFAIFSATLAGQPTETTFGNVHARVTVDRTTGVWSAAWEQGVTIQAAAFQMEIDGRPFIETPWTTETRAFTDALGKGRELRQLWRRGALRVEREIRLYDDTPQLTIGGRVVNETSAVARLGTAQLIDSGNWQLGDRAMPPAAVHGSKLARMAVVPLAAAGSIPEEQTYAGSGVLAFFSREARAALTVAYLRADDAAPDLAATFRTGVGGVALQANSRYLDRTLSPGATLELNRLLLQAGNDPYRQLETVGDAMAKLARLPVRTGPTSLWCSWYAHRLEVSEEKVLANAAVAARHFKPLGFEIMQVDHGWQRRDITGDWTVNERFPHGLKWLAQQLQERHGLKLGLWISPTDVADTSELFERHPEWILKGEEGKPKVNGKWYWKPNPNCYQLDVSQPAAASHVADVFRRLVAEDVAYFKIDFIIAQSKEQFFPQDPEVTRGWGAFRLAMEAVRAGAGDAWVRYCNVPPLLSVGLADGAYGGDDTADAGQPGMFRVLRDNARILATSYWLNDRTYQREVCDMSMRMHATIEEARVRAALMTLANTSISWSDELNFLPPSRIRMMQQCLPAGNPPMRPVDLFEREVPSVWHLKAGNAAEQWDVVGLFNFDDQPAARSVRFEELGLSPADEHAVFEFWEGKFLGRLKDGVTITLPPESSRILAVRRVEGRPQLIGTDMHVLQGHHEVKAVSWDERQLVLSGRYQRMAGVQSHAFFLVPDGYTPKFEFPLTRNSARLTHVAGNLWMQEIDFRERDYEWAIPFEKIAPPTIKEPNG